VLCTLVLLAEFMLGCACVLVVNFVCQKNVVCESGQVKDCLHVKTRMVSLCLMDVTTCVPELHGSTPLFPRLNAYVFSDIQLSLLNSIHLQTEHACEAVQ
jgi:hypothetical protein